jgi:hypothetical protein
MFKMNRKLEKLKHDYANFPHYEQQFEFTCGPACLMMIFKHYDKSFSFSREVETDIWRESSLSPLPPTSRYGLAYSAIKRGFRTEIISNVREVEYLNKTPSSLVGRGGREWVERFMDILKGQFNERKARALKLGLKERFAKKLLISDYEAVLDKDGVSLMLTSARFFDDQDWAHWVVVTGHDPKNFYINDPASPLRKGHRVFAQAAFDKINGYHGDQVMISIFRN